MSEEPTTNSGMLSLLELRRHLLREASTLATQAERVRHRGETMRAGSLKRRSNGLLVAAQRIADRMSPGRSEE